MDISTLWRWAVTGKIEAEFAPDGTRIYKRSLITALAAERATTTAGEPS